MTITHIAFSDEANWNDGQIRGLCLISLVVTEEGSICSKLRIILEESGIREFAWKKLSGAREMFAAQKLCDFLIVKASAGLLRIDCLTWNIKDSRHTVRRRDDVSNMERMYHHLFKDTLAKRWPDDAKWRLRPDEHTAIDWESVQYHLDRKDYDVEYNSGLIKSGLPDWRSQSHS